MKNRFNPTLWMAGVLMLLGTVPAAAQNLKFENALTRTIVAGASLEATQTLQRTVTYMQGAQTDKERDGILRMASLAIIEGADVRSQLVYEDGTTRTLLETVVEEGLKANPNHFANLYNLLIANGANPQADLHGDYMTLAQQLPLEQNQAWQHIYDNAPVAAISKPQPETKRYLKRSSTVTIHIPEEYDKYSCRKLAKMQEEGTLPHITVTESDPVVVEVAEPINYKSNRQVTIVIPEEYDKYSCRKLKKMQENGTLPKPKIIYSEK